MFSCKGSNPISSDTPDLLEPPITQDELKIINIAKKAGSHLKYGQRVQI